MKPSVKPDECCDEQVIVNCCLCKVPILSWWAPCGGGLLRGEYVLVADWLFHPKCWDKQVEPLFATDDEGAA
jgi:hypothetical protein